ncbi:MAG: pyruvate dehydrogenase E1 component alpha subunit [Pelagibacterales bacterium]|nr:pyruvate dehydrogenase E1 component alpha subunit [Pelagibacterales bacterium]|tara:strand:+ start:8924 stop:10045 length:1122 start_codon:yes stop_codon:yes gene_type:complete
MKKINHKNILKIIKYKKLSLSGINKKLAIKLYSFMKELRVCEDELSEEYHPADEMKCPVHFCSGQEAVPAALNNILRQSDYLFSHHRSHGYYLSKKGPMKKLFAEIYGKITGANSGLAGSQDISYPEKNFFSGAILAGAVAISVGTAMALKMNKSNNKIVVAGFGEAATDQGIFWESLNYAALEKLPIVFVCENNNYGVFSSQSKKQAGLSITEKAKSFGVESKSIFGNDVCLVYKELNKAILNSRKNKGPFLLETFTYRFNGHVGPLSDDLVGYRSENEIKFWKNNCPIKLLEEKMFKKNILNNKIYKQINKNINIKIKSSFDFAKKSKFPKINNWSELNISSSSKLADKILKDLKSDNFDEKQKLFQPKGY